MKTRSRSVSYTARLKATFPSRKCDSRKISASGRVQHKSPNPDEPDHRGRFQLLAILRKI